MQDISTDNNNSNQNINTELIKKSFENDGIFCGILHDLIAGGISESHRLAVIEKLSKDEGIHDLVKNFKIEIKAQILSVFKKNANQPTPSASKTPVDTTAPEMPEQQTSNINKMPVDEAMPEITNQPIIPVTETPMDKTTTDITKPQTPTSEMPVDEAASETIEQHIPVTSEMPVDEAASETIEQQTPVISEMPVDEAASETTEQQIPVTAEIQTQLLKTGEIPATPAPASKSDPVLVTSKTTFSMTANAKVNEDYRGRIQGISKSGLNIIIRRVDFPAGLSGLSFDTEKCEVYGTPAQAGEFELKVHFQFDPTSDRDPVPVGICQMIVNPDPRTLWKNLDSDKNDKYWKPDTASFFATGSDGLAITAASKRGRSHAHTGTFRDDDFRIDHDESTGWRIMSVADGAGSAKKSRRGSQIATKIANESVLDGLTGERGRKLEEALSEMNSDPSKGDRPVREELYYLFGNAANQTVHAISTEAAAEGCPYKDFSTTLIITIYKKFSFGHFAGAYWVGDGGVGIYLEGQEVYVLGKADSGEFAGQTRFLDSSMVDPNEIMNRIQFRVVKDFTAVVAMTDGITDPKFETDANIENIRMWDVLWSELKPVIMTDRPDEVLLDWLDFWSAGNHDDRTIGILYPVKSETEIQNGGN